MKRSLLPVALAAALLTTGCVTMGTNFDATVVDRLHTGMDEAQVVAMLGKPTTRIRLADGSGQLSWSFSRGDALGHGSARVLVLSFDASRKYTGVVSQVDTDMRMH